MFRLIAMTPAVPAPVLYNYDPSLEAAAVFAALFFVTTFVHVEQAFHHHTYYLAPLIVGGCFEWIGYIGRALAHGNLQNLGLFIFQTILLLLAPALFAATIYMILCRIIILTNAESLAPIPARWMTATFVCGDVLAFMVQTTGGGLMSQPAYFDKGEHLIILGLGLQIAFFGFFIVTGSVFHCRLRQHPTQASLEVPWEKHMLTLYVASSLILVRCIFRTIEFSGGYHGFMMRSEAFLYVFDSALMLGVMTCINAVHPGQIIGSRAQIQAGKIGE